MRDYYEILRWFFIKPKKEPKKITQADLDRSFRRTTNGGWILIFTVSVDLLLSLYEKNWQTVYWEILFLAFFLMHIWYRKQMQAIIKELRDIIKTSLVNTEQSLNKLKDEQELLSCPGDTILETLKAKEISFASFCEKMEMDTFEGGRILIGATVITDLIAKDLERVLEIDAQFWLNRELLYRQKLAKFDLPKYTHSDMLAFAGWLILDKNAGEYGYITNNDLAQWEEDKRKKDANFSSN